MSEIIAALQESDYEVLSSFVHKDKDDLSGFDTVLDFLKYISKEEIKRYRFMRFDAEHPDNKNEIQGMDGGSIRYSLPVEWVLTVYFSDGDVLMQQSADLLVGMDDGRLKFPTMYID